MEMSWQRIERIAIYERLDIVDDDLQRRARTSFIYLSADGNP
jgi:hypothetical protein